MRWDFDSGAVPVDLHTRARLSTGAVEACAAPATAVAHGKLILSSIARLPWKLTAYEAIFCLLQLRPKHFIRLGKRASIRMWR